MIKIPFEAVIEKIKEKSGLDESQINDKIQTKLDQLSGLISKEGAAHIIANELGVNLFEKPAGPVKIKDLLPGVREVDVLAKVTNIFDVREFNTNGRQGKVGAFVIADETGSMRVVCWNDQTDLLHTLTPGVILKLSNASVRDNRGNKEIHLGDKSKVELNPAGETVNVDTVQPLIKSSERKALKDLKDGDENVEILGTIVQIFDPHFFEVCPECRKRMKQTETGFRCDAHPTASPDYGSVFNVILDDGTETIRVALFREQAQKLLDKSPADMLQYRQFPEKFEQAKHDLLGQIVKFVGRAKHNQMFDRLEFTANRVFPNPNPDEELERLQKQADSVVQ